MNDQSKTTLVAIAVGNWSKTTDCSLSSQFAAAHAVAVAIASRCHMDIMSFAPYPVEEGCHATVVYANNGCSLDDVCRLMASEMNNKPQVFWMILDLNEWQGTLECIVSTRGTDEAWE